MAIPASWRHFTTLLAFACMGQVFLSKSLVVGVTAFCENSGINVEQEYEQSGYFSLNSAAISNLDFSNRYLGHLTP